MPPKPPTKKPPSTSKSVATLPKTKPSGRKAHVVKTFNITPWTGANEGEKITMYGRSGIGKTTLAATAPDAVFLGIDDGGRKIVHPLTGKPINAIPGIETFQDIRDVLIQKELFPEGCTIVIDTLSKGEEMIQQHVLENTTVNGQRVTSFRKFGWDGDRYTLDQIRFLLSDLDRHARTGRNIILLCQQGQIKVANAEGADYLEDGPFLQHRNDCSAREEVKQWSDHVLRIGYLDLEVVVEKGAKAGKVVSTDVTRAIFSGGAQHYAAKSRPINGYRIPNVISFDSAEDDSLWKYIFEGARVEEEGSE